MFYLLEQKYILRLPPKYFEKNLKERLLWRLKAEGENRCHGEEGFCIHVADLSNYHTGKLNEDTGDATFHVRYKGVFFRPHRNEILNAKVTSVTEQGIFCRAGPLDIFVSAASGLPE